MQSTPLSYDVYLRVDRRETGVEFALDQRRLLPIDRSTQRATRSVAPTVFGALMSWSSIPARDLRRRLAKVLVAMALFCALAWVDTAQAASDLKTYLPKSAPADFFPGADRFGPPQGDPPIAPVYRADKLQGFVYLNSDLANAIGYSGKPIHILVGIDPTGVVKSFKLIDHHEPIVLIGIPEPRIVAAVNSLIGKDMKPVAQGTQNPPQVDIVSGATVTILVMSDSILRSAVRLIRTGRIGGGQAATATAALPPVTKTLDLEHSEIKDWTSLLGDGSVRRLHLTIGDVNDAFAKAGNT